MRRRDFLGLVGAAAAWPLGVSAQRAKQAIIGYLFTSAPDAAGQQGLIASFREGMRDLGYVEGRDFTLELRFAENRIERLNGLANELVRLNVDVIVALATPSSRAAQQATKTVPIVASAMGDPIQDGLVKSLAHPGGNITGTGFLGPELVPKRLALLRELLPNISRVAVLWHPGAFSDHTTNAMMSEVTQAAGTLGMQLQFVEARRPDEIEPAFTKMASNRAEALFVFPSPMLFSERQRIVNLAATHRLPAAYNAREYVQDGGLCSYGSSLSAITRRAAVYVDKILKGAKPADLPVEQPATFELAINLKTAKALGIDVPLFLQQRADEVIE